MKQINMDYLDKLLKGNEEEYLSSINEIGDISSTRRKETSVNGQHPYAVIITCSDSRVIPEAIFHVGIGDLFVIRTAGNTIGDNELASIEYAISHLHTSLVVVLAHSGCGAIHSTIVNAKGNFISSILNQIKLAINDEKDELKASKMNALYGVSVIKNNFKENVEVIGMMYHIDTGKVELLKK